VKVGKLNLVCATLDREITAENGFPLMNHAVSQRTTPFDTAEAYGSLQVRDQNRARSGISDRREVYDEIETIGLYLWSRRAGSTNVSESSYTNDI